MITVTGEDIFILHDTLKRVALNPMKVSVLKKFYKIYCEVYRVYKEAEAKRQEIIKTFGKVDEKGAVLLDENGNAKIVDKYIDECRVELGKLSSQIFEVHIPSNFYKGFTMTLEDYLIVKKIKAGN